MRLNKCSSVIAVAMMWTMVCSAQVETALLAGRVTDPKGATVPDAQLIVTNVNTNIKFRSVTNQLGLYVISSLQPGRYRVTVSKEGFKTINLSDLVLTVQDTVSRNFELQVGSVSESVTVLADGTDVRMSPAVSTVVDQKLVRELPLNGRSFQTLFQLTPGVVIATTNFAKQGQFSVNGQRTNANYFTVDGMSANVAVAAGPSPGETLGGSVPAFSASGGTNSMVSTDAVQEFAIQTSTYAPEFGRTPGAQISVVTRSGTNEFHGDVFNYFRNDVLDANDWFSNHDGVARSALRQNDFGGVLGGPIWKNRTFFFFSYEGLRLRQPTLGVSDVPSAAARNAATPAMQPFLNAYPKQTGPDQGNGLARAVYGISNPSTLDAASIRVDHHFNQHVAVFGRYNHAPSTTAQRGIDRSLNDISETALSLDTGTVGMTYFISPSISSESRFNWTRSSGANSVRLDNFGGAVPFDSKMVFPAPFSVKNGFFELLPDLSAQNAALAVGRNVANTEHQINFIENVSWQKGGHLIKAGVDFRKLTPEFNPATYDLGAIFLDVPSAVMATTLFSEVIAAVPVHSRFTNYSLYLQDTWALSRRVTATYGLRWDYNPTPTGSGSNGFKPFAVRGINNLPTLSLAPAGTPLYNSTADNFAPRLGVAYQLRTSPGTESVIKAGAGIFYDLGNGPVGDAFGSDFPFETIKFLFGAPFPLSASDAAPPAITTNPPFLAQIAAFPSTLKLPYTYQWNLSIQQALGTNQTFTVGYLGAIGRHLIRSDQFTGAILPPDFQSTAVFYSYNGGYSDYNALQAQFNRRTTKGLDVLASYTFSHSLDNTSSDENLLTPGQFINPRTDYGSSDFDIRHTASVGIDYEVPTAGKSRPIRSLLSGWSVDPMVTVRSSPPVNPVVTRDIGFGSSNLRPDLIPGVPLYLHDASLPGETRINTNALSIPNANRQGDLRRNSFRGFSLAQADVAIRRRFRLTEGISLEARVEGFNVFNHPNFSPEANMMGTVTQSGQFVPKTDFGVSQTVLSQGLSVGGNGSGFNPLYQIGGPRSLQLALKLEF
jgi:hypothetical protein